MFQRLLVQSSVQEVYVGENVRHGNIEWITTTSNTRLIGNQEASDSQDEQTDERLHQPDGEKDGNTIPESPPDRQECSKQYLQDQVDTYLTNSVSTGRASGDGLYHLVLFDTVGLINDIYIRHINVVGDSKFVLYLGSHSVNERKIFSFS